MFLTNEQHITLQKHRKDDFANHKTYIYDDIPKRDMAILKEMNGWSISAGEEPYFDEIRKRPQE